MKDSGLMHVYFGDGKGKTTAAMGLALRASGRGCKVVIVQFMKERDSGELCQLEKLGIPVFRGRGTEVHNDNLRRALGIARSGDCGLLVLDEAMDAWQRGTLDDALLREAIFKRPEDVELVITGHKPEMWILDAADYVTEMRKLRHPYDRGVLAREKIEY